MNGWDQLFLEALCRVFAHGHNHGQGHAAFASRAKGRAAKVVHHLIEISIGHHNAVVFRAAHGLNAFARCHTAFVDVMRNIGAANEADRRNILMIQNRIDHFLIAMNDLQKAFWRACL